MNARAERKWYQKKTNKGIIVLLIGTILEVYPPTATIGKVIISLGASLGLYGVADRAEKTKKSVDSKTRTNKVPKPVRYVNNTSDTSNVNDTNDKG